MTLSSEEIERYARQMALSCLDVRPLIKGYFRLTLIVGAVMSSAFFAENRIRRP
jgi:hypothetical protein